jgi:hypothetical protein
MGVYPDARGGLPETASVTFGVTGLTASGWIYDASHNVRSSVQIAKP